MLHESFSVCFISRTTHFSPGVIYWEIQQDANGGLGGVSLSLAMAASPTEEAAAATTATTSEGDASQPTAAPASGGGDSQREPGRYIRVSAGVSLSAAQR